ncbi:MAG: ribosome maturation factor RimP [Acidimicrobiia bacterium]
MTDTTPDPVWELVEPYLAAERLELDDLELAGPVGGQVLRVVVDAQGGVDVERLADVARGLSRLLDARADLEGPYRLEVTSPGLERKLRRPSHFRKSVGREVVVKARRDGSAATLRGVLAGANDDHCHIQVDGRDQRVAYADVTAARTMFRWERAPKPGRGD